MLTYIKSVKFRVFHADFPKLDLAFVGVRFSFLHAVECVSDTILLFF